MARHPNTLAIETLVMIPSQMRLPLPHLPHFHRGAIAPHGRSDHMFVTATPLCHSGPKAQNLRICILPLPFRNSSGLLDDTEKARLVKGTDLPVCAVVASGEHSETNPTHDDETCHEWGTRHPACA